MESAFSSFDVNPVINTKHSYPSASSQTPSSRNMVEPVGTTLGAVSLATAVSGVFMSLVECYDCVELGRRFGKDFNKSQARLAALRLQLTRWAISSGALPDPRTGTRRQVNVDAATADTARQLLTAIRDDTLELQQKSQKYGDKQPPRTEEGVDGDLSALNLDHMMVDTPTGQLNARTNVIVAKRVRGASWARKTKWAVYEKKHFDRLLEDIGENFSHLEKILPQTAESQQELCRIEAEEVQSGQPDNDTAVMELLHGASQANGDARLENAVREAIISRNSTHCWDRTEVADDVTLGQGDHIASGFTGQAPAGRLGHNFGVVIGKGRANIHQGDVYK